MNKILISLLSLGLCFSSISYSKTSSSGYSSSSSSHSSSPSGYGSSKSSSSSSGYTSSKSSSSSSGYSSSKTVTSSSPTTVKVPSAVSSYNSTKIIAPKASVVADFKTQHSNDYICSFPSEPKIRPTYVPHVYQTNGVSYNVVYDPGMHAYGYYNMLGIFVLYDALDDMANRHYDHYIATNSYISNDTNSYPDTEFWMVLVIIVGAIFIVAVIIIIGVGKSASRH